jgi:hypothetical protein
VTMQELQNLATRTDFVSLYKTSHTSLRENIRNGNIAVHLVGTTIYIDIAEALAALGNPPLRSEAREATLRKVDLFA